MSAQTVELSPGSGMHYTDPFPRRWPIVKGPENARRIVQQQCACSERDMCLAHGMQRDAQERAELTDAEPCPGCGARRDDCIRVANQSRGRVCCVHCAEAPIGDTHRGSRP